MLIKSKDGQITKMPLAQWQSVIDVNLTGVFLCGREAAAWMVEKGTEGVIINMSSVARAGNIGQTNYSSAKAGVSAMTVTWAKELARFGIRTADIAPGFIETEMTGSMKEEAKERARNLVPLKRWGKPDNIAQAVAFILENDYFSGRTIEVDAALRL
jgi:3-oxoacyl-[acyl-carrier protein] reductase